MQQQDPSLFFRLSQTDGPSDHVPQVDGYEEDEEDVDSEGKDINSELDEEEDEEAEQTDHIILCQFEKVTRIKNKWKCILKDGIMNINGKDYLFNKANGDFEW
jgi:transcription initiation factor TFIIA large subunit